MFGFFKKSKSAVEVNEEVQEIEDVSLEINTNQLDEPIKRYNIEVKGTFVKENQKAIVKLIKELRSEDYFYEAYEGLKPKEIKEDYFGEAVYEFDGNPLPSGKIEYENDNVYDKNAIKVHVGDLDEEYIHVGYIPKELCEEIRSMNDKYRCIVSPYVTGGRYKKADYDEFGEEKVKIYNDKEYGIGLSISFWEN